MIQIINIDNKNTFHKQNLNKQPKFTPNYINKTNTHLQERKIGFNEGCNLFLDGILKQGKEMVNNIIQNPLKSIAIITGTGIAMMSLPLIGIPSVVGGGILAIGFAGLAITKAGQHTIQFLDNNKNRNYNIARYNLQQLGEDTFDLALSVPFVPKALKNIKNLTQYGKIGLNNTLIQELKTAPKLTDKLNIIKKTDAELLRNINFQKAVDVEIAKIKDLTNSEKLSIKKELLDFNIPNENLPALIFEKYGQIRGIKTIPNIQYTTMSPNAHGIAVANDCTIYLNDYKPYKGKPAFSNYTPIKQDMIGDKYQFTYKYQPTGEIIKEVIDTNILDDYNKLCQTCKKLSPQARRILTLLHEREHIHQFAQAFKLKGFGWAENEIEPSGKALFKKMISEMKKPKKGSSEALKIESFTLPAENGTPLAYVKRPLEIWARKIEHKAIDNPIFQKLDKIYKSVNKNSATSLSKTILLNDMRIESSRT